MRHDGPQREADAQPIAVGEAVQGRRSCFRSTHREEGLALEPRDNHLPPALGYGGEGAVTLTMTPLDPLDKRRVRRPLVEAQDHVASYQALRVSISRSEEAACFRKGYP